MEQPKLITGPPNSVYSDLGNPSVELPVSWVTLVYSDLGNPSQTFSEIGSHDNFISHHVDKQV